MIGGRSGNAAVQGGRDGFALGRGVSGSGPRGLRRSHAATGFLYGVPQWEACVITEVLDSGQSSWDRDTNRGAEGEACLDFRAGFVALY